MKKHYKPKLKNITKLKSYLNNADKKSNRRCGRSSGSKRNNS